MKIDIDITVKKWRPWMRKFNLMFSRGNRMIEIMIIDEGAFKELKGIFNDYKKAKR